MENNKLILIAGGTASGKSIVADILKKELDSSDQPTTIVRMDNYYKSISDLKENDVNNINWDKPLVFDWKQLSKDVELLLNGKEVLRKKYHYETGTYGDEESLLTPNKNIIVEGLFVLRDKKLRKKSSLKIYVDVNPDTRMKRRIKRDSINRYEDSFNEDEFIKKWNKVIQPMHEKYVLKTRKYADEIIFNDEETKHNNKVELIKKLLDKK